METFNMPVVVGDEEAGRAKKIRKAIENLLTTVKKSTFDVAELLYEVKRKRYYQGWGFDSFKSYIEQLDIKQRKANYLVRIVEVCDEVAVPRDMYEPIGLSKLREITSLEPSQIYQNEATGEAVPMRDIIVGMLDKAPEMSLTEIKETVKGLKGLTGEDELVWINVCVKRIVRDEVIQPALELAKNAIGSVGRDDEGNAIDASDGRALEMICADFSSDPANNVLPMEE